MKANAPEDRSSIRGKLPILILAACIVAVAIGTGISYYANTVVKQGSVPFVNLLSQAYQFEVSNEADGTISVRGWFLELGTASENRTLPSHARVMLADLPDYAYSRYVSVQEGLESKAADTYYDEDADHNTCAFQASIRLSEKEQSGDYEILFQPSKWEEPVVHTGYYLHDGQVVPGSPSYVPPDTEGTVLEDIVQNGMLRICRPEEGIWVYQYQWKLYYIVDAIYLWEHDWEDFVAAARTNHPELVSRDEETDQVLLTIHGMEDAKDPAGTKVGLYEVGAADLPDTCPVAAVDTGVQSKERIWIWHQTFCPGVPDGDE